MKQYKQLSYEQRCHIFILKRSKLSQRKIASMIGVHQSTVSREFQRNSGGNGYLQNQAQILRNIRQQNAPKWVKMTAQVRAIIRRKLQMKWSPEQISGWLKKETQYSISHETIYQYILYDRKCGGKLYKNLRRKGKKYYSKRNNKSRFKRIKNRISITERPTIVEQKTRIGDWEIDTVLGKKHSGAIVTIVERKTKFTLAAKVPSLKSSDVIKATIRLLKPFRQAVFTITADNGSEFSFHSELTKALKADVFFCHPYSSHERGLNENTNGLLRQYWPKGKPFTNLEQDEVYKVVKELNRRPRKTLQYLTPESLMRTHLHNLSNKMRDALQG